MNVYFDEAGNTGSSGLDKNTQTKLNFIDQPVFALGMLIIQDENDAHEMLQKFTLFKKKFNITSEIKGNQIVTKKFNEALEYLFTNFFDDRHFKINLYDKRFYISTLLLRTFSDNSFFYKNSHDFYLLASCISKETNVFFEKYCECIANYSKENYKSYLSFLSTFEYKNTPEEVNLLKAIAKNILEKDSELETYDEMYLFDDKSSNLFDLVNLNALFEEITWFKSNNELTNSNIDFIHDNIDGIKHIITQYAYKENLDIIFEDSKENAYLQMIDYLTSIFLHFYIKTLEIFQEHNEWKNESSWILSHYSKIQRIINERNIKYTIPICDWAMSLAIKDMFAENFSAEFRNNICFNQKYLENQRIIESSINQKSVEIPNITFVLRR